MNSVVLNECHVSFLMVVVMAPCFSLGNYRCHCGPNYYIDEDHNLEAFEGLAHFVKSLRVVTAGDLLQHLPKERQGSEGWDFANRAGNIVRPHEGKAQK